MFMLSEDQFKFENRFPEAFQFVTAARIRQEIYELSINKSRNEWQTKRLIGLLSYAPACRELWFLEKLKLELNNSNNGTAELIDKFIPMENTVND